MITLVRGLQGGKADEERQTTKSCPQQPIFPNCQYAKTRPAAGFCVLGKATRYFDELRAAFKRRLDSC